MLHTDEGSSIDEIRPRCLLFQNLTLRAKCGALGYNIMNGIKKVLPEFFTAKSPQEAEEELRILADMPHTLEWDWSEYDSSQTELIRLCVDVTMM